MIDLSDDSIDAALDAVDLAHITEPDDGSSGAPACISDGEPDLTPHEWTELRREIATVIASMRSAPIETRPA